jgi:hypothetical protein
LSWSKAAKQVRHSSMYCHSPENSAKLIIPELSDVYKWRSKACKLAGSIEDRTIAICPREKHTSVKHVHHETDSLVVERSPIHSRTKQERGRPSKGTSITVPKRGTRPGGSSRLVPERLDCFYLLIECPSLNLKEHTSHLIGRKH